jgi:hypothetical protein
VRQKPSPTVSPALAPPPPTDESPDANGKAGDGRPAAPGGSPGRAAPVGARRPSQPRSKKRKGRGRR